MKKICVQISHNNTNNSIDVVPQCTLETRKVFFFFSFSILLLNSGIIILKLTKNQGKLHHFLIQKMYKTLASN